MPPKPIVKKGRGVHNSTLRSEAIQKGLPVSTLSVSTPQKRPSETPSRASSTSVGELLDLVNSRERESAVGEVKDHHNDPNKPTTTTAATGDDEEERFPRAMGRSGRGGRGGRTTKAEKPGPIAVSTLREELFNKRRKFRTQVFVAHPEVQPHVYACALRYSGPRPQRARNVQLRIFTLTAPSSALEASEEEQAELALAAEEEEQQEQEPEYDAAEEEELDVTEAQGSSFATGIECKDNIDQACEYLFNEVVDVLKLGDVSMSEVKLKIFLGCSLGGFAHRNNSNMESLSTADEFMEWLIRDELKIFFMADAPNHVADYMSSASLDRIGSLPPMQFELAFYAVEFDAAVVVILEQVDDGAAPNQFPDEDEVMWKIVDVRSMGVSLSWQLHIFGDAQSIQGVIKNALEVPGVDRRELEKTFNHAITASVDMSVVSTVGMVTHDVIPFAKRLASQIVLKSSAVSSDFPLSLDETADESFLLTKATMRHHKACYALGEVMLHNVQVTHYEMPHAASRHEDHSQVMTGRSGSREQKAVTIEERQWYFEWMMNKNWAPERNARPVRQVLSMLQEIATGVNGVRIETKASNMRR